MCRVSISQVRICGCSEVCGEVKQRLCKDCGEVVNNWLVNWRRANTHAQLQAIYKGWAER